MFQCIWVCNRIWNVLSIALNLKVFLKECFTNKVNVNWFDKIYFVFILYSKVALVTVIYQIEAKKENKKFQEEFFSYLTKLYDMGEYWVLFRLARQASRLVSYFFNLILEIVFRINDYSLNAT